MTATPTNPSESLAQKLRQPTIPGLNGLRALAIILVFLIHADITKQTGVLGVEGFFVLSGFLITWKLLEENDRAGSVSLKRFYINRTLRIFPAFYVFWCLSVGQILLHHGQVPWRDAFAAFFYISNYYQGLSTNGSPYMLHTWSLSVEEQFYLLWPTLFICWRLRLGKLTRVLSGLIAAVWIYRAILVTVGSDRVQWYLFTAFESRMDQLAIGCLLAVALRRNLFPKLWRFLCAKPYAALLTVALLAISEQFADRIHYRNGAGFIIEGLLCAVFLVQAVAFSDTALWSWLNSGVMSWLGRLSYSIYLYHELALAIAKRLTLSVPQLHLTVGILVTLLCASASYFLVERPFLRLKKRTTGTKPAVLAVGSTTQTLPSSSPRPGQY